MKPTRREQRRPTASKSPLPAKNKPPHVRDLSASLHGLEALLDIDDHEFSFSREHPAGRILAAEPQKAGTSSSSNSTNSTREVSDASAKVEKALKSVNSQLSLIETKQHSESYACTMALKKAKDKLLGLASLDKALTEKRAAAEEQERKLSQWQQELLTLQSQLETRTKELNAREMQIDEYVPRIQMLEQEVAEARKVHKPIDPQPLRAEKSLPKLTEIEGELKRTAALLESRTYELIREERELQRKESELQSKQAALLADQGRCLALKTELESNSQAVLSARQEVDSHLTKLKKLALRKEAEIAVGAVIDKAISAAANVTQSRLITSLDERKRESQELIATLEAEICHTKELQTVLQRETASAVQLQVHLKETEDRVNKKEAIISGELALIKEGKADLLLKRREEAVATKEKAFNEKLKRLKELQTEVREKEEAAQLLYEEAVRKAAEADQRPPSANSLRFDSIFKPSPEVDLRNREQQLELRSKALTEREKLLIDREASLKELQRSVECKQERLKSLWSSLASAANLISRSKETSMVASPPSEGEEQRMDHAGSVSLGTIEPMDVSEVANFTESFRVRQQQLIEHFADVERERREMSETLKEFLGPDNVVIKW